MEAGTDITVRMRRPEQLVRAPALDLLSDDDLDLLQESALDRITRQVPRGADPSTVRVHLELPSNAISSEQAARLPQAVRRYAAVKKEATLEELKSSRHLGLHALWRSLLVLMFCVGVVEILQSKSLSHLPHLVTNTLAEGLNIIGWVMLWRPFEAFVFDPIPLRREINQLEFLERAQFEVTRV